MEEDRLGSSSEIVGKPKVRRFGDEGPLAAALARGGEEEGRRIFMLKGDFLESPVPGLIARVFYVASEGDLWLGTNGYGLVHLRRRDVQMFTKSDGLGVDNVMALHEAHDGTLWIGSNCGLYRYDGREFKSGWERHGLSNNCVWALAEDRNRDLWVGTYGGGIYKEHQGQFTRFTTRDGLASDVVLRILVARDDSLWIVTLDGLSHMRNGHFRNYTTRDGLSANQVLGVHQDRDGVVWVATQVGIDRLAGDRFIPFSANGSKNGSFWTRFAEDSSGNLFTLGAPSGVGMVTKDRIVSLNDDLKLLDMVESPDNDLWFSSKSGIIRARSNELKKYVSDPDHDERLDYQVFDRSDGLASVQCSVGLPNIVLTTDGKLWVATVKGLAMMEVADVTRDTHPPKVFVGGVTIGNKPAHAGVELVLVPGTQHVELHLEAVDLASPEKVRLQYRMDDVDAFWIDADGSRTAVYSSLPAGSHAFHVRASASNGVWDRTGIVYRVTQQPYFYQTRWFMVLSACCLAGVVYLIYAIRVRQLVNLTQVRMMDRMEERERIARELHDTLLQGVLSSTLQLEFVEEELAGNVPARSVVTRVLQILREVAEEGRLALRGLRTPDISSSDLGNALSRVRQEVSPDHQAIFQVHIQNAVRPLKPKIENEVYRIGREAVLNALLHADATKIDIKLEYSDELLRLTVRDDGKGIDPLILSNGKEGHWGLSGMRERAERIGAKFSIRSEQGGTEINLTISAANAFKYPTEHEFSSWVTRLGRRR